jgi:hypothetical protein
LEDEETTALAEVSRNIFCKFSEKKVLWDAAAQAIAQLDALLRYPLTYQASKGFSGPSLCL